MKMLLINQTFYPDVASTAQHLTDFAVDMAKNGFDVTVLTSRRSYAKPGVIYPKAEVYQGVKVIRVWAMGLGKGNRVLRVIDSLWLNFIFAWHLFWLPRFDKIIALTSPPLVGWVAAIFSKLRRSEMISWVMDINPDEAILAGWVRQDSFQAKILKKALQFTLKNSHKIIVLDEFMRERILLKGVERNRVKVIPPWSHDEDLELVAHEENPFRREHRLEGKFVVMYSGNHSLCHPLDTLLEAARQLKDQSEIIFIFIGGGERVKEVLAFKEKNGLQNILYLPYQERSALKYSLSAADLHVVTMGNEFVGVVHPCKIYGILRVGRPFLFIGPEKSHIGEMIAFGKVGKGVRQGGVEGVIEVIRATQSLPVTILKELCQKERALASKFSRKILSAETMQFICG